MLSNNTDQALRHLGARLRTLRLARDEPQARFAARLGISVPTLRRLEQGDPGTQIGHWFAALETLGRLHEADAWLAPFTSLFAAAAPVPPVRQRARRRRAAP
jgi:transcriptional regulator with XRE-family HTH domain